eukprot:TRINITY_DN4284_c0_g2_i2.p1 TRINITY_DN4284_c0_g2~~TRINITY_DN4284_c0_g2_i2.p1  ORF type:complete len:460 (+),score=36.66 TRINITY_DN4284_c0_g2_i2:70-1449(+)
MEDGRTEVLSGSTSTSGSQPSTPRAESSMGETLCSPTADGSNAHAAKRREKSQRTSSGLKWRTFGRSKGLKGQALEMHRMIQSEIAETAGEKSRVSIDSKYDNGRWWRNVFCIANATIGIIFMIVAAGIGWDGEKYRSNSTTDGLKGIVSIFSFLLVLQIIEYHRFKTGCVFHTYVKDSEIPWTAFSKDLPSLLLECVVCGYHIPPFCSDYIADKWMIFMFCRAYILLRFLRDISPITDHKNRIITHGFYHLGGSSLNNWLFHARTFIYRKPGTFIVTATAIVYFIMTFSVYVFERHRQPDVFDFKNSLWYTAVTMTTVGFGDIVAKSHMGRVLAVVSGALGIILSSFCVTIASQILTLSNHQKFANDIVQIQDSDRRRLHSAATVIQCWWRLLRLQRTGVPDTMVEYQCRKRLIDATSRLRRYRRSVPITIITCTPQHILSGNILAYLMSNTARVTSI